MDTGKFEKPLLYIGLGLLTGLFLMSRISFLKPATSTMSTMHNNIQNEYYDNEHTWNQIDIVKRM